MITTSGIPPRSKYIGDELELFQHARRWKAYVGKQIRPFLKGDVLEVGAGNGVNASTYLSDANVISWTCLEPDPELAAQIRERDLRLKDGSAVSIVIGTTFEITGQYDTILYFDVLEHIEDDRAELERAEKLLKPDGTLIVLAPAHDFLYSEFDAEIGHYRRYDSKALKAAAPSLLELLRVRYLDSIGILASCANRIFLKQKRPSIRQVLFWDKFFVTCSRFVDPIFGFKIGKSVLGIWKKTAPSNL